MEMRGCALATGAPLWALTALMAPAAVGHSAVQAQQSFRFSLRAEPDVLPANGISTTSISVQVANAGAGAIAATPIVRFVTTAGSIEPQAPVVGGVARALLRSSTTPGTAIVTAFIGNAREQIAVEFTGDEVSLARYVQVDGAYVAYGSQKGIVTASGRCSLDYGDLRIESDQRLDVDLHAERVWAQGNGGGVLIRNLKSGKVHTLRGDRLFYDLKRRRGVMRRVDTSQGPARQEFMDSDFRALPPAQTPKNAAPASISPANNASASSAVIQPLAAITPVASSAPDLQPSPQQGLADSSSAPIAPTPETRSVFQQQPALSESASFAPGRAAEGDGIRLADAQPRVADAQPHMADAELAPSTPIGRMDAALAEALPPRTTLAVLPDGIAPSASGRGIVGLPGSSLPSSSLSRSPASEGDQALREVPEYSTLPSDASSDALIPPASTWESAKQVAAEPEQIVEPMPPQVGSYSGYWVAARKMRVFARDKVQFEKATVYLNGRKLFSMPRYVASLDGSFNPATDMVAFNSSGGLTLNVPYYYQASKRGTGTVYLQHAPSNGFAAENPGFALALDQQYWLNDRSQGRLLIDQIGRGWNLNWEHKHQFSPSMRGEMYLDMPRHRNAYLRSTLIKEYASAQLGFEGLASKISGGPDNAQGQFFARLRPRLLGSSGWSYTLAANLLAVRRYTRLVSNPVPGNPPGNGGGNGGGTGGGGRPGGGVGLPGRGPRDRALGTSLASVLSQDAVFARASAAARANATASVSRPLFGQSLLATLQSPTASLWRGASIQGSVLANGFNYSDGRRGVSPGLSVSFQQQLGRVGGLQIDYNYDRGGLGLLGPNVYAGSSTNFVTGSFYLNLGSRLAGNAYFTKSLSDGGLYGVASLDFYPVEKWRLGLFTDYSSFADIESYFDYGLSVGRQVGQREISVNWSRTRGRVYLELGSPMH
jgi:hypothetical protein